MFISVLIFYIFVYIVNFHIDVLYESLQPLLLLLLLMEAFSAAHHILTIMIIY